MHGPANVKTVVLHGCKFWCRILREERRRMVSCESMLRIIYGPKRKVITENCGKLYNDMLHTSQVLSSQPYQGEWFLLGLWHIWKIGWLPEGFLWESQRERFNPLKPELNPIYYFLALLAHHFHHVSRIRVKTLTFRRLMSYIYIYIWSTHSWCF